MKKFELLREDKLKRRLIRENVRRVHMTAAAFAIILPIIMILHAVYELPIEIRAIYYSVLFCLLNWNPRFQFAKVNPCSGYFLQE